MANLKIFRLFKAFYILLRYPKTLNLLLHSDIIWKAKLNHKYQLPTGFPMINFFCIDDNFSENLPLHTFLGGSSLPTDIALLRALCKKFKNCTYFEIGTWRGESVVNVSDICHENYTLNLPREEMINRFKNKKYANLHGFLSQNRKNITHLFGDSLTYDFKKLNKKFDVIFIDGDHTYGSVKSDTENAFKHLIHESSIIVWHDYAYNPEMLRPEVILGILDGTPDEYKQYLYYVSNTLCAIFYKKKLNTSIFSEIQTPENIFSLKIEPQKLVSN